MALLVIESSIRWLWPLAWRLMDLAGSAGFLAELYALLRARDVGGCSEVAQCVWTTVSRTKLAWLPPKASPQLEGRGALACLAESKGWSVGAALRCLPMSELSSMGALFRSDMLDSASCRPEGISASLAAEEYPAVGASFVELAA